MFSKVKTFLFVIIYFACQPTSSAAPYPYTACNYPRFSSCAKFQQWWDRNDETLWANCPWIPIAKNCWNQDEVHWRCPLRSTLPQHSITARHIMALHDWSVGVTRLAEADGLWTDNPRPEAAFQYLNGLTMNYSSLGFIKRKEIAETVLALTNDDIDVIVEALLKYSNQSKIDEWTRYIMERVPGCANDVRVIKNMNVLESHIKKAINAR